jgi:hypothetical protein
VGGGVCGAPPLGGGGPPPPKGWAPGYFPPAPPHRAQARELADESRRISDFGGRAGGGLTRRRECATHGPPHEAAGVRSVRVK